MHINKAYLQIVLRLRSGIGVPPFCSARPDTMSKKAVKKSAWPMRRKPISTIISSPMPTTRGGPASTLIKLARSTEQDFEINETLCLNADVHAFARPSVLARFTSLTKALFVPETQTEKALTVLRRHPFGQQARHVSQVKCAHAQGLLALKTMRNISRAPAY